MSRALVPEPETDPVDATPTRAGGGDLFAELDQELGAFAGAAIPSRRGPGRPPGSPNRTTLKVKQYLLAKGYRDPAEYLAALMSAETRAVAAAVGADLGDVLKLQVRAAEALMPYFHQAMPKAVEVKAEGPRTLIVINDKAEQFQRVIDATAAGSHDRGSHDDGKSHADQ